MTSQGATARMSVQADLTYLLNRVHMTLSYVVFIFETGTGRHTAAARLTRNFQSTPCM